MESYQGMNQFQNQGLDPNQNQSVESYPGQKSVTYQTCTHATDSYHKNAAESFYLDEMKKLEMERALWKKDEQAQCKEISRLNDRIQMEVGFLHANSICGLICMECCKLHQYGCSKIGTVHFLMI